MTIEEKAFGRKRFAVERMLDFGFEKTDGGYRYETDFFNGDFSAVLLISDKGEVTGTVIDRMNGEEYRPLRNDTFQGGYVNSVRSAYEDLLGRVADGCCRDVLFASDQANRIAERIAGTLETVPDYPWEQGQYQSCGVFRHGDNSKWFALIMNLKRRVLTKDNDESPVDILNLKAEPDTVGELTRRAGIYPAYHMNRKHWISVSLDDTLTDDGVMALVSKSFELTKNLSN